MSKKHQKLCKHSHYTMNSYNKSGEAKKWHINRDSFLCFFPTMREICLARLEGNPFFLLSLNYYLLHSVFMWMLMRTHIIMYMRQQRRNHLNNHYFMYNFPPLWARKAWKALLYFVCLLSALTTHIQEYTKNTLILL